MRLIDADKLSEHKFPLTPLRYHVGWNDAIDAIVENAPTIEAESVKHARWILLNECSNAGVYCSACHKKVYKEQYANQKLKSKYCPNCGSRMDLEGENKEY